MKIKEIQKENRPRERLNNFGKDSLSNQELLAIVLETGYKNENAVELANRILSIYQFEALQQCTIRELTKIKGVGFAKACKIISIFEIAKRNKEKTGEKITSAKEVAELYMSKMQKQKEHFLAIYLDTKNKIIKDEIIFIGTLNASLIHPREIFHGAIKNLANSIILLHNHPSGDPTPSPEDIIITKRLIQSGEIIDIPLLDHIIIGKESYWSYRENKNLTCL